MLAALLLQLLIFICDIIKSLLEFTTENNFSLSLEFTPTAASVQQGEHGGGGHGEGGGWSNKNKRSSERKQIRVREVWSPGYHRVPQSTTKYHKVPQSTTEYPQWSDYYLRKHPAHCPLVMTSSACDLYILLYSLTAVTPRWEVTAVRSGQSYFTL